MQQMERSKSSRPILLTPGPTEADPRVLAAMSHVAESHLAKPFSVTIGEVLGMLRKLFQSEDPRAQAFVIGGSGSLGWDFAATNFIEPGENVLYLSPGFFDNAFEKCLASYGACTKLLTVPFGCAPDLRIVEEELRTHKYKALVVTHVDTSTGVLTELQPLSTLLKQCSPETLFIVDGVASVGCEDVQFDKWTIDVCVTGSQKALSCPPGLSIIMVSARAIEVALNRKGPSSWYSSLPRWLPIMQKYEQKEPSYFATPPTQIIHALHVSLSTILASPLQQRYEQHKVKASEVRCALKELGLTIVACQPGTQANGVTALWLPEGITSEQLRAKALEKGIILAGGMHSQYGVKYARFGHMGFSVVNDSGVHVDWGIRAVQEIVLELYRSQTYHEILPIGSESGFSFEASEHALVLAQA